MKAFLDVGGRGCDFVPKEPRNLKTPRSKPFVLFPIISRNVVNDFLGNLLKNLTRRLEFAL